MKHKNRHIFDRITFRNRWLEKYPNENWTIIGISEKWQDSWNYKYKLCFFGFEMHIWIKIKL